MIVEILFSEVPEIKLENYARQGAGNAMLFYNPATMVVEVVLKKHPDGRASLFTDRADVISKFEGKILDVHVK